MNRETRLSSVIQLVLSFLILSCPWAMAWAATRDDRRIRFITFAPCTGNGNCESSRLKIGRIVFVGSGDITILDQIWEAHQFN